MVWLQQHAHFSCLGTLDACLAAVTTVMLCLAIGFSVDARYCTKSAIISEAGDVSFLQCNRAAADDRANAMWLAFALLFLFCLVMGALCNWGRPYNIWFVGKPIKHCGSCHCDNHIHPTEGQRLNSGR